MDDDKLYHYGTPRHSGRYPWGSGKDPYQSGGSMVGADKYYQKKGMTKTERAHAMGYSRTEYDRLLSNANAEKKAEETRQWQKLKDKGWSPKAIGERYGVPESTVRSRLKSQGAVKRVSETDGTAEMLKERLEEHPYIDVSPGNETFLNVSPSTFAKALTKLNGEGYQVQPIYIPQVTNPDKYTTIKILTKEGVERSEILANKNDIAIVTDYVTNDDGRSWLGIQKPESVDSSRVMVRYAEDGGAEKDGVIELRRGVDDLSMGNANYAQVRIAVDGTHYMKGMAIYSDGKDWPEGVDIIYNSHYTKDVPALGADKDHTVMKLMKKNKETGDIDWANPFGSLIKIEGGQVVGQRNYVGADGEEHLSPVNIVKEAGDWNNWSKTLSSQFLSKQYNVTIKQQLDLSYDVKKDQFNEIMELTSPEVKTKLLNEFADECDSAAVHLKAAALPRQATKVILPVPGLKENEVYAPTYNDGEQVILVRHPHEGTFQIPTLTVNNKSKDGQAVVGKDAIDAIGIHPKAAQQLSGADFDGDTVIVIPTSGQKLKSDKILKELDGFEPSNVYPPYEGMPRVGPDTGFHKQTEMGKISNLITDMTIIGADEHEIARAVKYSMTVIDAEKHNLDWRGSFEDNRISELKEKYQGGANRGASTLISKASSTEWVNDRKVDKYEYIDENGKKKTYEFNPETGEKTYTDTGKTMQRFVDIETGKKVSYTIDPETKDRIWRIGKNGAIVDEDNVERVDTDEPKKNKSSKMAEVDDAYKLSSGTTKESMYADYANNLKALAKKARLATLEVGSTEYNPTAAKTYAKEVEELKAALNIAKSNAPYERQAQIRATYRVEEKLRANPEIKNDKDEVKKLRTEAITAARNEVGASRQKRLIDITDRQWEAITSGAIRPTRIKEILSNANPDKVKKLATPKNSSRTISASQISRMKAMSSNGATLAEIANALGISTTTVYRALNE